MIRIHLIAAIALVAAAFLASPLPATQTSPCITTADRIAWLRRLTKNIYGGRDSTATVAEGLPWARYDNVPGCV
jgi:hypothetical protein